MLACIVGFASPAVFSQSAFDATYDFGDYGSQIYYPSCPDGEGGYRLFRFKATEGGTLGVVALHLNGVGTELDAIGYTGQGMGGPQQAFLMPDSSTVLRADASILRIDRSGEIVSLTGLLPEPGPGSTMCMAPVNNNIWVAINDVQDSPVYHEVLRVLEIGMDGSVLQQRSFHTPFPHLQSISILTLPDSGFVLAGKLVNSASDSILITSFSSDLDNNWSKSGQVSFGSVAPIQLTNLSDSSFAVIWDGDFGGHGGLLKLGTDGEMLSYQMHSMPELGDAEPLADGGWLFLNGSDFDHSVIRHFSVDGALLGSGTVSGQWLGQIHPAAQPGWWDVLSGTANVQLSMDHFNLLDGTCLVPPIWSVTMEISSMELVDLQLEMDTTSITSVPMGCTSYPVSLTRTVGCGTAGIEEHAARPAARCEQMMHADGGKIAVLIDIAATEIPKVRLLDAIGRELPHSRMEWSTLHGNTRTLRFQQPQASGMAILQLEGKEGSVGCKLILGLE